jgi:hypothetical protein
MRVGAWLPTSGWPSSKRVVATVGPVKREGQGYESDTTFMPLSTDHRDEGTWMKRLLTAAIAVAAAMGLLAGTAQAAPPVISREVIDVPSTYDDVVSEECGFDVYYSAQGFAILRTFENGTKGVVEVGTINEVITLTGPSGKRYQIRRNVGADVSKVTRDGTTVKTIAGQVPFQHTGVLKIDLATGTWIFGPSNDTHVQDMTAACAALAP